MRQEFEVRTRYEQDVVLWAKEQAALLRSGQLSALDIEHIAEEIEDVGKSEQRELVSRLTVLLAHLLKWQYQPGWRGNSWRRMIAVQRKDVALVLDEAPSLKGKFSDSEWFAFVWEKAVVAASNETGLEDFAESCPWSIEQIMDGEFLPG